MKDKASVWMGADTTQYDDVDRYHALETMPGVENGRLAASSEEYQIYGDESKIEGKIMKGFPDFGHNMRQYWMFDKKGVTIS